MSEEREYLIRTVLGEAARQPEAGQAAVAHVILNRAKAGNYGGGSVREVVTAPNQFEPWGSPDGRRRMMGYGQNDPAYQTAARIVDGVMSGQIPDPTSGATHFLNEAIVRERRGGGLPKWAVQMENTANRIGDHTFYGGNWSPDMARRAIDAPKFDPAKLKAAREGRAATPQQGQPTPAPGASSQQPTAGGEGTRAIKFDPAKLKTARAARGGQQPATNAPQSATPAFDAFVSKHTPNASPEEIEAMRSRMSNPARYGNAVAGFAFPFADEAAAGIGAGIQSVGKLFTDEDVSFSEDYQRNLDYARDFEAATDELQGSADEILGGAAMLGGGGALGSTKIASGLTQAATRGGRYARGGALGASGGAAYGFAEGEGEGDRALRAAEGAVFGAAGGIAGTTAAEIIGGLAKKFGPRAAQILNQDGAITPEGQLSETAAERLRAIGIDPDQVTDDFTRAFAERSGYLPDEQAARAASLDAIGAPGTQGQITGDVTQEAAEASMRAGANGGQVAANRMRQFDETQAGAVDAARAGFGRNLGGGHVVAGDAVEASGVALQGVQRRADEAKSLAQAFYKKSEEAGVRIRPEAFDDLMVRIEDRLAGGEVIVDAATPQTNRMMDVLRKRATRPESGGEGDSLKLVDNTRSRVGKALRDARRRGDTAETEALSEVLGAMDDWIDDAVDDAMFDAGPEALKSLKAARKLWADYRKQFFGKKGADKFIAKMAEDEASPRDVFAWLYSNGRMGGNRQSTEYAAKLKDVLGEGSEEWAAIRQGAWAKLTQGNAGGAKPGYQKTGSALVEFLTGETRSLARTLFSPDEIKEMFVFARAMKTLTPQKAATNPSGSGYEARRLAETAMRRLGEMLGFAAGGLEGALAGGAAARGAAGGGGWLKARVATGGARPSRNVVPGVVGGNLAVGQGRENYGVRPLVR